MPNEHTPQPAPPADPNIGHVQARNISEEMSESYLNYAMTVIISRALPDVRDGLKPVHRRVLYAMHQMGMRSRSKHVKSAKIVGEVLGKFHPHSDQAAYDTLARMAQDFSMRYLLVDGQGNFGSMDGDAPAAMRYTEARPTPLAEELLADIEKETVAFMPNYDSSTEEPKFLPAKVPNLLLNGALGIAVGMATSIPTHNLREVVAATKAQIDNPELTVDELMQHLPGPDFPTGGLIYNTQDIRVAYATGKGSIVMRAVARIEEKKSGGQQIVVSAIPYQVNKADLVAKIADLVKEKRLEGISDLRDESDRNDSVRIVVELKATAYPKKVLNQLFELTPMQTSFHVNMLAIVDGIQPRILSLREVLAEFIDHRVEVVRRRTTYDLKRAEARLHILEGLRTALDHIDAIITLIRGSETREEAHAGLRAEYSLSDLQATAILEMRLSALAGLERKKVIDEIAEKETLIAELKGILASPEKVQTIIKTELDAVAAQHGDDRRTEIIPSAIGSFSAEDLIPDEQVVITLTNENYIKRVSVSAYKSQQRGGKGIVGMTTKEEDAVEQLAVASTHDDLLFFTSAGRLFRTKVYELPAASRQAKGTPVVNIVQLGPSETVTAMITLNTKSIGGKAYFLMGTRHGVVKKTAIEAYANVRRSGIIAIGLKPGDDLRWVKVTTGDDMIVMVSHNGQAIQFEETDVRPMGRSAAGVRGMKLRAGDEVMAMMAVDGKTDLLVVLENGFGKRTSLTHFGTQRRGGIGLRAAKVTKKTGPVVAAELTVSDAGDVVMISKFGQTIRLPLKSVKRLGRDTQGVTLMRFREAGDLVASMTVMASESAEPTAETTVG